MNFSLKSFSYLIIFLMSLVGGMATWALDSFTTYLHEDTTAIHKITLTIDAVRNLETNLYSYSRASMLWKDTQDRSYLFERNEMFLKVNKALLDVRELVHSQESRKVLKDLEEKTTFYFKTRLELENAGSKSGKIANEMAPYFDGILAAARQLNKLKLRQAFDIYNLSLKRDQLADYFGIFILLTLIGSLALIIFMFHKLLYSPLIKLQMSMKQYLVDRKILVVDTGLVELRAISQTFAELADQLHQQRIAQVRYLAGIVHDLRNPISAISMAIEIADSRFSKEENSSDIAQIIRRQADQLNSLVGDLLENAAIDSGDFELNLKSTDLRQCVREVYLLFEKYSANHKLKIEIPDTSVFCQIDNQRINQVIVNLVSNALKFSPAGGEILISLRQTSSFAEVSVQDHGIGVDECDKEKIFEPFRRSKTVQGSIAGSGLGLYTVKRIILAHHGSIEVKSTPGKCTIFICKIPLATSETDERLAKRG